MSQVTTIADKICELIKSETACNEAVKGIASFSSEFFPIAQIALDDAEIIYNDVNNTYDVEMMCYVMVDGNSFEQVQEVLEDITTTFLLEANFVQLHALDVIDMKPSRMLPAINFEGNVEFWRGAVHFDVSYRVIY